MAFKNWQQETTKGPLRPQTNKEKQYLDDRGEN